MKLALIILSFISATGFASPLFDSDRKAIQELARNAEQMTEGLAQSLDRDRNFRDAERAAKSLKLSLHDFNRRIPKEDLDDLQRNFQRTQRDLNRLSNEMSRLPMPLIEQFSAIVAMVASIDTHMGFVQSRPVFGWVPTNGEDCSRVCRAHGLSLGVSPDGAQCASGEVRPRSAYGIVTFHQGCWPNCDIQDTEGAQAKGRFCYRPGQRQDNDRTDRTMACFCD